MNANEEVTVRNCNTCKHSRATGIATVSCYSKKKDKRAVIKPYGDRIARRVVNYRFELCKAWEQGTPSLKITKSFDLGD